MLNRNRIPLKGMKNQVEKFKSASGRRIIFVCIGVLAAVIALALFINLQTYSRARVSDTYKVSGDVDGRYEEFAEGVLKYSRDGIAYLDRKGEEKWNQSCQIKNPFVEMNDVSVAVADKGGNNIMVFQEEGLIGEIETTLPIENLAVSEQGITAVILKNGSTPSIICYDIKGNILVEHQASFAGAGYPLDVSISPDGEVMQVVYMQVKSSGISSKVVYYNFGEKGEAAADHEVSHKKYENSVVGSGFFMTQQVSAVVGDNCLTLFKGKEIPEEVTTVTIEKEIESVFHNDRYIGMILKNEGNGGYELRLYNKSGKKVMSKDFSGSYKNAKISGNQVLLYDGKKCRIFLRSGVVKFEGELKNNILEIFPILGVNKYIVMNTNGMEHVQFVK